MIKRRAFLLAMGALAAERAQAQPAAKVAQVAYLSLGTPEAEVPFRRVVNEGLWALGWIEGRNLLIEERYAETRTEDLPRLVAELLRFKPDVIVCFGPTRGRGDPVAERLVSITAECLLPVRRNGRKGSGTVCAFAATNDYSAATAVVEFRTACVS
jgi:hypothetical protein